MLEVVGRYRIEERIGEGAMADVYRAYDPTIHRSLAVKVLKAEFRRNPDYAGRFVREAKAAGALSHPNIVTIFDVGEVDGYPFIVMELLDGQPLSDILAESGALPPDRVMAIGLQLADALAYAHSQGVVHRDIKPANVMVGADGRSIKLLDFGIARLAEGDLFSAESVKTQVGQMLGTPSYMSPEQALGQEIDGRSDLFSVGVVLYEMITGVRAFAGASAVTLAVQIAQRDPQPLAKVAPQTPRGLQFIVTKLLSKRPDRRFQGGAQLAEALRKEIHVQAAFGREEDVRRRYLPLQLRMTLLMGLITAVVLAAAVGAVMWRQYRALEQMALASGSAISSFVAQNASLRAVDNATLPPDQRDWAPVEAFVQHAAEDPNVRRLVVADADGIVRAANDPRLIGARYAPPKGEPVTARRGELTVTSAKDAQGRPAFRFMRPIIYAGRSFGQVEVSLSKAELEAAAHLSELLLLALGLVTVSVVAATTYVSARMLGQPIRRLTAANRDVARGDLDFRISHHRRDEFGELFDSFNLLTQAMQERLEAVESIALDTSAPVVEEAEPAPMRPTGPFAPPPEVAAPSSAVPDTVRAPRGAEPPTPPSPTPAAVTDAAASKPRAAPRAPPPAPEPAHEVWTGEDWPDAQEADPLEGLPDPAGAAPPPRGLVSRPEIEPQAGREPQEAAPPSDLYEDNTLIGPAHAHR